jgi:hypothetical protein
MKNQLWPKHFVTKVPILGIAVKLKVPSIDSKQGDRVTVYLGHFFENHKSTL